ncbi:MAG: sigma-70 family RNA polymerase sigma factor [Planctomycetes bacterium]|nr:sigma-70 family RNA polymerase sigma factor [Planctomycetota bacterium]
MTAANAKPILDHIRRLAPCREAAPRDSDLLQRYLERRDEAAFRALVERHGPMVLGVCQAVLQRRHDAEDAFQSAFLILARKAGSIRRPDGLACWLHGVAYRVARKAQAAAARRQAIEISAARRQPAGETHRRAYAPPLPTDDLSWGEVRAILHAELGALPERFRAPLVLCYLEGLTQDEAARRLGWTAATVKGRLQRGRAQLRRRLERRGLGLAGALGTLLTGQALAGPLPPALAAATVRTVLATAGVAARSGTAAPISRAVWTALASAKVRVLAAVFLVAVALAGGAVPTSAPPAAAPEPAVAKPAAKERRPGTDLHGDPLPEGAVARLGTVRFNHGDGLNALHFSPDGKTVLSEGGGFIRLWDAATGKELRRFATGELSPDDQTVLSADGKTLTLLNQENGNDTVRVWDLDGGKEVRVLKLPVRRNEWSVFRCNALSRDGRLCAIHTPKNIQVFDAITGKELWRLPNGGDTVRMVIFAGNDRLVTSDKKRVITMREARTGKVVRQFDHGAPAEILAASPDGSRLATLQHHNHAIDGWLDRDEVRVWDLGNGTLVHTLTARPKRWFMTVRFSPDGKLLVASSNGPDGGELTAWDAKTGTRVRELAGVVARAAAVSPDGVRLAVGLSGKFHLWDLKAGQRLSSDDARHAWAAAVFLSPAGDRVFTVGYESVSAWDGATGRRLRSIALRYYPYADPSRSHSPDGRYALSFAGDDKRLEILLWDVAAGRLVHTLRLPGTPGHVTGAFSPDSSLLATWHPGKKNVIRLWDVGTGKALRSFPDTKAGWPGRLAFSPDGKTLLVAGRHTVGLDVGTGKERFSWRMQPGPLKAFSMAVGGRMPTDDERVAWRSLAFAPGGTLAACVLQGSGLWRERTPERIVLCEARTGKVLRRWDDSGLESRSWELLDFSPDDRLLASTDGEVVHVWEVLTGKEVYTFRGHRGEISSLSFSASGRRLASAAWDSTALIWDLPLALGGARLPRPGEKELAGWWADLAGEDAGRAWAAVWRLADAPAAVPFLGRHLKPATEAEARELRGLIDDLGNKSFAVRSRALVRLKGLGLVATPLLRRALEQKPPLEVRGAGSAGTRRDAGGAGTAAVARRWRVRGVVDRRGPDGVRASDPAGGPLSRWLGG